MFQIRSFSHLSAIIAILFLLINTDCTKKQKLPFPEFNPEISAFTSGVISSESFIRIHLSKDFPGVLDNQKPINIDLFEIKPDVDGKAYWIDNRTIEYRPEQKLLPGNSYKVKFKLSKLFNDNEKKDFDFQFNIIELNARIEFSGIKAYSRTDLVWNEISGIMYTSDKVEPVDIEKIIYARQGHKTLSLRWSHLDNGKTHLFTVDSVMRTDKKEIIKIDWEGEISSFKMKGSVDYEIPSLVEFTLLSHKVIQQPEQYISLQFSDPIKSNQYLNGLIRLENNTDLRFTVEDNEIKVYPLVKQGGTVELTIEQGIQNILSYRFPERKTLSLDFESLKPAVRLIGNGVIIPESESLIFPFEAVNLKAIDVKIIRIYEDNIMQFLQTNNLDGDYELRRAGRLILKKTIDLVPERALNLAEWNAFALDLTTLLKVSPGAIYRVELGFRKKHSLFACPDSDSKHNIKEIDDEFEKFSQNELAYWDASSGYNRYEYDNDYYYDYNWEEMENPCSDSYYGRRRSVGRNILASNLGIIAKSGSDKSFLFAITDLKTTEPINGVNLEIYNFQNQLLTSLTTDNRGLAEVKLDKQPFLLLAKKGPQRGYLRLDNGSSLSLSQFDVSGNTVKNGIKGYIYGERGVWRPGDTLFLNFILEDKMNNFPENHPVIMELWDARGKLYKKIIQTDGLTGFYHFRFVTDSDAPTGSWRAVVKVGGLEFSSLIRIETVKPNRLKMNLDFTQDELYSDLVENTAKLSVNWLYGAPAKDLKVSVSLNLSNASTTFPGYERYSFTDPSKSFYYTENEVFNGRLDSNGEAAFSPSFDVTNTSPGKLTASFLTKVFEKGGDFSIDQISVPYSPYPVYVGLKAPEGDKSGILLTDTIQSFDIVTLSERGKPVHTRNLEIGIYKLDWRWWWHSADENLASYMGSSFNKPVFRDKINIRDGKGKFNFRVDYPDWGRYLVKVSDISGGHSTGMIIYFDWPGWVSRAARKYPDAATMLTISSDKDKYYVGETASITIPSGEGGRALVCIENGTKVLDHYWLKATEKESTFKFTITEQMTPNVYVNVSFIQPHAQLKNDLPVRMYGVIPISVEDPLTRIHPIIEMPEVIRPESVIEIKISEANKREMTYTIAMVDEGLLDLTRFKTPDPWNAFYAREALGVKTFDVYDLVLGAFGGRIDGIFSIGGGEDLIGRQSQVKANRFKPVVRFIGPVLLKSGKTDVHRIAIPNYVGSVKLMVVAGYKGAYGNATKVVPVRKPLMILTSMPRVLGPGESLSIPVNVFAMEDQIKKVDLKIESNQFFNLKIKEKTVLFDNPGDMTIDFEADIIDNMGIGRINFFANSGKEEASEKIEIDIRSPNPPVTEYYYAAIDPGESWEKNFILPGIKGTNTGELEFSSLPPVDFGRRLKYLVEYPYGCLEQITSGTFPQLFLTDVMEVNENFKNVTERNIKAAIQSIQKFQLPSGGMGVWPNSTLENEWTTSYAGHFMLEAQKKGYSVPKEWIKNWTKYQKNTAKKWNWTIYENNWQQKAMEHTQAYRLYTLALAGESELGSMNRLREKSKLDISARWMLSAAYALVGQKETAKEIIKSLDSEIIPYQDTWYTYGSELRDKGFILETMNLLGMRDEAVPVFQYISEKLSGEGWYNTQALSVCLMAVAKFAGSGKTSDDLNIEFSVNSNGKQKAATKLPYSQIKINFEYRGEGKVSLTNTGKGLVFIRLAVHGIPKTGQEKDLSHNLNLTIRYKDMNGNSLDVTRLEQGTDFIAEVRVLNSGLLDNYQNLALSQIFPSGWEIQNQRLFESNLGNYSTPAYQDYRDDRVYTFFSLRQNESKIFAIKLHAAYKGRFYLPGVMCNEMYRNDVQAYARGGWIEVVEPGH